MRHPHLRSPRPRWIALVVVVTFVGALLVFGQSAAACHGRVTITKRVTDGPVNPPADTTYTIRLTGPESRQADVRAGGTVSFDRLPPGDYTISEDPVGRAGVTILPSSTFTVPEDDDSTFEFVVRNRPNRRRSRSRSSVRPEACPM